MAKRRMNIMLSKTTDMQLYKMIDIVPFLTSRSQAIAYAVQQFVVEWAIDNDIPIETLEADGEYAELEITPFANSEIPSLEETKKLAEERKLKRAKMKEEIEKAKEAAKGVKVNADELDWSEFDE